MDKRKVITAYRRGMISREECAQILGIDSMLLFRAVSDNRFDPPVTNRAKESLKG
ncbi:hypothetical protein MJA45_16765 [Paenibacillus aurantius]|uniref:Uncharacterized protein n=1 Tax=Paenibacillus aurantius TaxID=2918900 RepID=A0AA96RDC9_9BACL|nr:hypothetical protein [Paenibacillus aurantius]WNQ09281.1 hypothetical protein MJA45_16765 [Paenibacillus aurantius]